MAFGIPIRPHEPDPFCIVFARQSPVSVFCYPKDAQAEPQTLCAANFGGTLSLAIYLTIICRTRERESWCAGKYRDRDEDEDDPAPSF